MGVHQSSKLPFLESRGKDEFHPEFSLNNRLGNEPVSFFFSIMTDSCDRSAGTLKMDAKFESTSASFLRYLGM